MCVWVLNNKVADPKDKSVANADESSGDRDLDMWLFGSTTTQQVSPPWPAPFPSVLHGIFGERERYSAMVSTLRPRVAPGEATGGGAGEETPAEMAGGSPWGSGVGRKRAREDHDPSGGLSVVGGEALREAPVDFPRGGSSLSASSRECNAQTFGN